MTKKNFKDFVLKLSNENYYQLCATELSKRQMIDILLAQKKKIVVANYQSFIKETLKGTKENIHDLLFPVFYNLNTDEILDLLMNVHKNEVMEFLQYFPEDQLTRIMDEELCRDIDTVIFKMGEVIQTIATKIANKKNTNEVLEVEEIMEDEEDEELEEEITELEHGFKMFTVYDWDSNELSGVRNEKGEEILSAEYNDIEIYSPNLIAAYRVNPLEKADEMGDQIIENWEIFEIYESFVRQIKINIQIKSINSVNERERKITIKDINGDLMEYDFDGKIIEEDNEFFDITREEKILNTFWTKEEIENYEKLGITKFSKWDIHIDHSKIELFGPPNTIIQNVDRIRNKKFFFFKDYYLGFWKKDKKGSYIIGKDPDRNPNFNLEQE